MTPTLAWQFLQSSCIQWLTTSIRWTVLQMVTETGQMGLSPCYDNLPYEKRLQYALPLRCVQEVLLSLTGNSFKTETGEWLNFFSL